jgi:hypothetical protein
MKEGAWCTLLACIRSRRELALVNPSSLSVHIISKQPGQSTGGLPPFSIAAPRVQEQQRRAGVENGG